MKPPAAIKSGSSSSGMSLVELMVAMAIAAIVTGFTLFLFISSLVNFAGLGNYAILTDQSRMSLAVMAREMREASKVVAVEDTAGAKSITLTNMHDNTMVKFAWDAGAKVMTMEKSGQPSQVRLTGCDRWQFSMYQRNPKAGWTFVPTADLNTCKLISMTWKCSRTVLERRINTETVVTAQVVLRNKP